MSQYEEMYLGRLACELGNRVRRVTGRKWKLFQQAATAELMIVCLTYLMLEHYFKSACSIYLLRVSSCMLIFN